MATRKYKITFMAHITFLLNNTAQGGTPCFEGFRERLQKQIITGLHGNTRINILVWQTFYFKLQNNSLKKKKVEKIEIKN